MASDLPETGYRESMEMVRALVTYIADDVVIERAVREEFSRGVGLGTIRKERADHLKRCARAPEEPHKPHEGYYPGDASERLALTNKRFLAALEREREISCRWAISCGILDSPALRDPALVDKAWEREIAAAKREADL
jgi:hypothetical protein